MAAVAVRPALVGAWDTPEAGLPLLRTYTARDTGTLAPYRCSLLARDGRLYVAHDGLSVFDGETWRTMPLPDRATVRALAEDRHGRIWVGGENLLGSLTWMPGGAPEFSSALALMPPEYQHDLGCVGAVSVSPAGQIVAVTENRVFSLRPSGPQVWALPATRRLATWHTPDGRLIIAQPGTATLCMGEAGLESVPYPEALASAGIEWAVSFPDHSTLLSTGRELFRLRDGTAESVTGPIAELLRDDKITSTIGLAGGFAALATQHHGIQIIDSVGRRVATLDSTGGLPENRVVHLSAGPDGRLVATTPESVVVFCDELRATGFTPQTGQGGKRIAAITRHAGSLFVLQDRQLLRLPTAAPGLPGDQWEPLAESPDRPTALLPLDSGLVAAAPSGIHLLDPVAHTSLPLRTTETTAWCPRTGVPSGLTWIEGSQFLRGTLENGQLRLAAPPLEIDHDACDLTEDANGANWVATTRSGVLRIAPLDQISAGKPPVRTYRENLRSTGSIQPRIFRVGPRILVTTENGLALYSDAGDRFVPLPSVSGTRIHAVAAAADGSAWLALSQRNRLPFQVDLVRLRASGNDIACEPALLPPAPLEDAPTALFAEPGATPGTTTFWLGGRGRLTRLESRRTLAEGPAAPNVSALSIFDDRRGTHSLVGASPRVAFDNAGLRFDIHVPGGRLARRVSLETRLADFDPDWVPLGEIPSRVFRGLRDGAYRFEARAIDSTGRASPLATVDFSVMPPWWRSAPAYVAYALALVLLSGLVFLTRLRLARTHRRELEALVDQRTRELAAANSAKSDFLAHINHEIRNPLNGVIGLSAMLAHQHQDESTRQLARSLKACAGYLGSVVDNVLDLARIESGRIEITPQRFEPHALIEDVAEMFRLQVEEAGGRITWSADPDLPRGLVGDVHRIRQVLVNFTANAARYARGGDVRLSVRRRAQSQHRLTVVFTVADTGPGIAPAEQAHIFEKFSRGASAAGNAPRGYGLGLALVRDLATLLGGEADVDSQLGYGAKFRLTVPLDLAPDSTAPLGPVPARPAETLRVLVIDDQAFNRLVLRDHLERLGCKVEESADGPSAHLLLQARAHHIAFVDLDLPGLDGLALMRRVRAERPRNPVCLVATTASATRGIQEEVLAAGADAFLPKPISAQQLATLLQNCADLLARPAPPAAAPAEPPPADAPGLFADLPLTPDLLRSLHTELDVETQSLISSWRLTDRHGARRHAHRIASLGIIARDEPLVEAARRAEDSLQQNRSDASRTVDVLQHAARTRLRLLGTTVTATGQDGKN